MIKNGDSIAVVNGDIELSYKDIDRQSNSFANGLLKAGFKCGDKIVLQLPNYHEFIIIAFAMFKVGIIPIMSLPAHRKNELKGIIEKSEAVAYIAKDKYLGFSYEKGRNVVSNLSFNANQGEVTAIVGPSGCGKSTILKLLSRLYDYNAGQILIGGKDISEISTNSLFENISTVFQDVELFDDTIFENIKCGNPKATIEEVLEAAKIANVDEIADKFVDKYDTKIGENGSKLSGGERQRISIARAILKDAPIILLDEISASLDIENEIKIQAGLDKLIKNKTVIIVSHRMKSIENANKIIVIENGKVENFGTHSYLLENSTRYRKLVECSQLASEYEY